VTRDSNGQAPDTVSGKGRKVKKQKPYGRAGQAPYGGAGPPAWYENQYKGRLSEPKGWQPFAPGGLGIMARRTTVDPLFGLTTDQLATFATSQPMRLLALLPTIHPSVGYALWSALRLMFPADGFKIQVNQATLDSEGASKPDDKAQVLLDAYWTEHLPQEIGGLNGLVTTMAIQALFSGLVCMECVPGVALNGVDRMWPVDSLSITFIRPGRNEDLEPYQKQLYPNWGNIGQGGRPFWFGTTPGGQLAAPAAPPQGGSRWQGGPANSNTPAQQAAMLLGMNYVHMDKQRFFWRAIDADVDDPYGMAPYAACLSEILADLALMQDLRDAVHNAAWPRMQVGVNLAELHRVAVEVHRMTDATQAAKWVMDRFDDIVDYVGNLNADDNVVSDSNGTVSMLQPGGFQGLEPVLNFLRQRIVQSLKTLPTLMGINEGAAMNTQSVEWGIYAAGLEAIRAIISEVVVKCANLHLRLLGVNSIAKAVYTPIRTNDELVGANTENIQLQNQQMHEKMGYKSHDEAAVAATGHKAVGAAAPGMIDPLPPVTPGGGAGPTTGGKSRNNLAAKSGKGAGSSPKGRASQRKGSRNGNGSSGSGKGTTDSETKKAMKTSKGPK
jgi:uncharacterized membrane protein YgcG